MKFATAPNDDLLGGPAFVVGVPPRGVGDIAKRRSLARSLLPRLHIGSGCGGGGDGGHLAFWSSERKKEGRKEARKRRVIGAAATAAAAAAAAATTSVCVQKNWSLSISDAVACSPLPPADSLGKSSKSDTTAELRR